MYASSVPPSRSKGSTARPDRSDALDFVAAPALRWVAHHAPAAITATNAAADASVVARRPCVGAIAGAAPVVADSTGTGAVTIAADPSSIMAKASAVGRSAMSLARPRVTTSCSATGVAGAVSASDGGAFTTCADMTCCGEPPNGAAPASSSYPTAASEYTSARPSRAGSASTCSGAM